MPHITIIAEIGSSPAPAWDFERWCAAAAAVGADAVKAQCFKAEHFPAGEQESKRPLEFPRERLGEFVNCAHAYGLQAGVSVFDDDAVTLARWCDWVKLAAREQYNDALIETVYAETWARRSLRVYRSLSTLAVSKWLFHGAFTHLFAIQRYPAPLIASLAGLARAALFFRRYGVRRWGYSSHTTGTLDCVLAARLGATVIEKHFALSPHDLEAGHSLLPEAFTHLVHAVRRAERKS